MITVNGVQLRNLEEQVRKNKEDIAAHYNIDRVLADFGIRIIGQVADASGLPDPETFAGDYGDAYAVGTSAPYSFYIWTRADVDAGYPDPYWFDIGQLAIVGPEGPAGPQGPQGPQGEATEFLTGTGVPGRSLIRKPAGTLYLRTTTGDVYQKQASGSWTIIGNIQGPQGNQGPVGPAGPKGDRGPQGLQGPQGTPGKSVNIVGIVENIDQLPDPASISSADAYLVTVAEDTYKLYIINSYNTSTGTTYYWREAGFFNSGSVVIEGGNVVPVFDADDYLKLPAGFKTKNYVCLARYDNAVGTIAYGQNATSGLLVQRTTNGAIRLPNHYNYPPATNEAVPKGYVDDEMSALEDKILKSAYRSAQMTVLTANSGVPRNISNLATPMNWNINGARIVIYFPSEQGSISIGDSKATSEESDIGFTYRWYANTGCKWAEITIESTSGLQSYAITFRSGDGSVAQVIERQTTGYIQYVLTDEVTGQAGTPYREEITYYNVSTTIPMGIYYPN